MNERIEFGLSQSCGNKGNVGCVSVFGLQWWGVSRGLGPRSGVVGWYYVCVSCESGLFM